MDWEKISKEEGLTESFMKEHAHVLNWNHISGWIPFSKEEFIEEMKEYIDWFVFSYHRNLSEEFMEKYQDRLVWYFISFCQQHLSYDFIKRNISCIHISALKKNENIQFTEQEWWELQCLKKETS